MRFIFYILYAFLALVFIWLAVANRGEATISLSPLDYAIDLPLFFVMIIGLFLGVIALGPGNAWRRWKLRRELKKAQAQNTRLSKDLESITAERDMLKAQIRPDDPKIEAAQAPLIEQKAEASEA